MSNNFDDIDLNNFEIRFYHIEECLKIGHEIEFGYNGKNYSITNRVDHYWYIWCNDGNLNEKLCEFEDKDTLVSKVRDFKIEDTTISEIFDKLKYDPNFLFIL